MENIKLNLITGKLGSTIYLYNKYYKLSNNLLLIRNNNCLQLCELKNNKFKEITTSKRYPRTILGIVELKDKNIMISGPKFLDILTIKNSRFEIIKTFDSYEWGELISICQLENEKILVFSNCSTIYIIEKKEQYEIKEIKTEHKCCYEKIGNNKILFIESFYEDKNSIISILDFNKDIVDKRIINNKYKIIFHRYYKTIFNLQNGIILFATQENEIFLFDLKYEEIINIYVFNSKLIEIINYKDDEFLCIFDDNNVALVSCKYEFIIKEIKLYDVKKYRPLRFITMDDQIYLYCDA